MKTSSTPLHYLLLTSRTDQLWLPAAFWALFAIVTAFLSQDGDALSTGAAFLGSVLPLIGGILAAYAILSDPALELHFATPLPGWKHLLERLSLVLAALAVAALSFQAYLAVLGVDVSPLGGLLERQLVWLVPTLALMALGCVTAFALAQPVPGAMFVGLVWVFQAIAHGWMMHHRWARYVYLFMGFDDPTHPALAANQITLSMFSLLCLLAAWMLFKKQERYL